MSIPLIVNGVTFQYPTVGNIGWGEQATLWASAITNGTLQKTGGLFSLTSDLDFGPSGGLKAVFFSSRTIPVATTGVFRLGNNEFIGFRNATNTGNATLGIDASDNYRISTAATPNAAVIQANGNFGIGTPTPTEKLEVNGNIKANNFIGNITPIGGVITAQQVLTNGSLSYTFNNSQGTVSTNPVVGFGFQNTTPHTGVTSGPSQQIAGVVSAPQFIGAPTGTTRTNIIGIQAEPVVQSSSSTSVMGIIAGSFTASRSSATDTSTITTGFTQGISVLAAHGPTLPATTTSGTLVGVGGVVQLHSGIVTGTTSGLNSSVQVGSFGAGTATAANVAGVNVGPVFVGGGTGTYNITNFYGLRLQNFTVGAGATITNRYGISSEDPLAQNVFAGNTGIGTTTLVPWLGTTNPRLQIHGGTNDSLVNVYNHAADAGGPGLMLVKTRAAGVNDLTPPLAGDSIGSILFGGTNGTFPVASGVNVFATATENWSSTARGSKIAITTIGNGTTNNNTVLTLDQDKSATFTGKVTVPQQIINGNLPWSFTSNGGITLTYQQVGLGVQNTTPFTGSGAAFDVVVGVHGAPITIGPPTGSSAIINVGVFGAPVMQSSSTTSLMQMYGGNFAATRGIAADVSTAANIIYGVVGGAGHALPLPSTASSSAIIGGFFNPFNGSGIVTTELTAVKALLSIGTSGGGITSTANAYGFYLGPSSIGTGAGSSAAVTNFYGMRLQAPTVGAGGTITNRYGISQEDTLGKNFFAGNIGMGTQSLTASTLVGSVSTYGMSLIGRNDSQVGWVASNLYFDAATNLRTYANGGGNQLGMIGGIYTFSNTPSAAPNTIVTPVERMRIDANGNVGIGTSNPDNGAGYRAVVINAPASVAPMIEFRVDGNYKAHIATDTLGNTLFGSAGQLVLSGNSDAVIIKTAGTERMRITTGGDMKLGGYITTNPISIAGAATVVTNILIGGGNGGGLVIVSGATNAGVSYVLTYALAVRVSGGGAPDLAATLVSTAGTTGGITATFSNSGGRVAVTIVGAAANFATVSFMGNYDTI